MAVYVIDEVERTIQGQKVANIANIAGAFVKSLSVKANGALEAVIQNAGSAEATLELTPGKVAENSITTAMLQDDAVTADKLSAGVGQLSATRIDDDSVLLVGSTRAVAIADYALVWFECELQDRQFATFVIPAVRIAEFASADTDLAEGVGVKVLYHRDQRSDSNVSGACGLLVARTTNGRLRYKESGGAFDDWRIYGIK